MTLSELLGARDGDRGFRRGDQQALVSTHNMVRPKVAMKAEDYKKALERQAALLRKRQGD